MLTNLKFLSTVDMRRGVECAASQHQGKGGSRPRAELQNNKERGILRDFQHSRKTNGGNQVEINLKREEQNRSKKTTHNKRRNLFASVGPRVA